MLNDNNSKLCVLIVDDDHYFNKNVLGYALEQREFSVLHAYTVKGFDENWEKADVIVLDIRLPEREGVQIDPWGGLKALKRLQDAHPRKTQLENCIIRSAHTQEDSKGAGIPLPRWGWWFPPDTPYSALLAAIRRAAPTGGPT